MQMAAKKIIPHVLEEGGRACWGLTRIMSREKLSIDENSYRIQGRRKPFVSKVNGGGTCVFFLGGLIDKSCPEFLKQGQSRVELIRTLGASHTSPDSHATGLASLIGGENFSVSTATEIKNIAGVTSGNLREALEICVGEIDETVPTLIFVSFTPNGTDWDKCGSLLKRLVQKNVPVIIPSGSLKLNLAINVSSIDVNDKPDLTTEQNANIFAPGVDVAAVAVGNGFQMMTGTDVAAAFVAGVGVNHLSVIREENAGESLMECFLRTCPRSSHRVIPVLWNPYQIFEPTWDNTQDAFLGAFSWNEPVEIRLRCMNIDEEALSYYLVHSDLPSTLTLKDGVISGTVKSENGGTHCYHFVIKAKYGECEVGKMFYITFTDVPFKIETAKYRNLNEISKVVTHYSGNPNSPTMPPFHVTCSCLAGSTKILMADNTEKYIRDLTAGDKIRNRLGSSSEVTYVMQVPSQERQLFSLNDGAIKLTACHRILTTEGPASIRFEREVDLDGKPLVPLTVGSILFNTKGEKVPVYTLEPAYTDELSVYNLMTDNDAGYVANNLQFVSEIFTSVIFARSPKVKGEIFAARMTK